MRGGFFRYFTQFIGQLPIRRINFSNREDKVLHDRLAILTDQIIVLHKNADNAKNPHEKLKLQRQIAATDRQIDKLVYQLYGLTEEEIKIVEESQ